MNHGCLAKNYLALRYMGKPRTKYTNEILIWKCLKIISNSVNTCSETNKSISKKTKKFKHTILFPSTLFPGSIHGNKRIENENKISSHGTFGIDYCLQEKRIASEYILHDGPPYANGRLHMGHALNKILKDVIVRYKYLKGYKVNFIPGWDCHGLPIELKALEKAKQKKETTGDWENFSPIQIRTKAKLLAEETIQIQKKSFKQWGLFVDWNQYYCTFNSSFIAKQLKLFELLYEKGYIFQSFMPVHFSPSTGSSLAESELEYNENHISPSLYLALPLENIESAISSLVSLPIYLCIWTTTPWTLPANMAISIDETKDYALVEASIGGKDVALVWINDRIQDLPSILQAPYKVLAVFPGINLKGLKYIHPLNNTLCPVVPSSHVSSDKGTGLVHTAPAHGKEDFLVALSNGITTDIQLIDDKGVYKAEAGKVLHGKRVLEEGNDVVIQQLKDLQREGSPSALILNLGSITHSYPYDWRTKKPTIVRASKQWFFDISKVREAAVGALENVTIHPEKLRKRFLSLIEGRPYWCLSRQRVWGVPIPVFYEAETHKPLVKREFIDYLATLIEKEGPDVWWNRSEEQLLPPEYVQMKQEKGEQLPVKGTDILDIWFDSGSTWFCALDGRKADLYLEGHDQANGWFQSSLLISVAATGQAPYKTLFLHGFTVDQHHQKMSKSLRNVFDPELITNGGKNLKKNPAYGVSVLRWWALKSSPVNDVPFGMELVEICDKEVNAIRNAFSYFLGSLNKFNKNSQLQLHHLRPQEQYLLSTIKPYLEKVWNHLENFEYESVPPLIYEFIVEQVGNEYMNSAKDTLYFELEQDLNRNSIQTAVYLVLPYLLASVSPILPHLAEEVSLYYKELNGDPAPWKDSAVEPPPEWSHLGGIAPMETLLEIRRYFRNRWMEEKPNEVDPMKFKVRLRADGEMAQLLKEFQKTKKENHSGLCSLLRVSEVTIEEDTSMAQEFILELSEAEGEMCARCRKLCSFLEGEICSRCKNVINSNQSLL